MGNLYPTTVIELHGLYPQDKWVMSTQLERHSTYFIDILLNYLFEHERLLWHVEVHFFPDFFTLSFHNPGCLGKVHMRCRKYEILT